MSKPNYSLTALQTFSVVTKELNFSKAAEVLNISPSAVSHQMKLLESQLGMSLFHRKSKGVTLTNTAKQLAEQVNKGFELIDFGVDAATQTESVQRLVLAVVPSLLDGWLVPRLNDFYDCFPNVELQLIAADKLVDFNQRHIHGHLHFGHGQHTDLECIFMAHEYVYPVCAPNYNGQVNALSNFLAYQGGAEDAPSNMSWEMWFKSQKLDMPKQLNYRRFSHVSHTLTAAKCGQGIALGWHYITSDLLHDKALVKLPFKAVQLPFSYHLVMPKDSAQRSLMRNLTHWLKSQFARSQLVSQK
ncbi:LysR family transcriptional regulator [Pseudoalteromonas luteoviolacea]|uniref:LysR substrate-binding domain-containing protein n=1 Tax=Pseudoalteromonas luteoviolacea TaxID=43657 RepID=UPI001B370C99|nr:LysR substrate-binding domain-containing protein [Pseudoalteromonas luteoviolacea]MBQ4811615.1 LysR family transcriptional regulator [Pseudoalteromonas luteoviolacea]